MKAVMKTFFNACGTFALLFSASAAQANLPIQTWRAPSGAKVMFVEARSIPMIDVNIDFDAGSRLDPADKAGVASLTHGLLALGAGALSEQQISDRFADVGAQRGGGASTDRAGVSLRMLSSAQDRAAAVVMLASLLTSPTFPEAVLAREKSRAIASLKEEETKPETISNRAFSRALYGNHPYGIDETAASLSAVTRDDLVAFHRAHYGAARAVVSIIGDLSRAQAEELAQELTRALPQGVASPVLPPVPAPRASETRIAHPASQAHILLGSAVLKRGDPDFFALTVGNYVLGGGGFVSRLMNEVREKRGLAYSVYSYFQPMRAEGPFQAGLQTRKEQADEALKLVREVVGRYVAEGPTEAELKAAKDNLIGGFALRIDSNRKILDNLAVIGWYDLPLDWLDAWTARVGKVGVNDVRAAFKRRLNPGSFATVVVGGAEKP
jgi:zinc protease